MGKGYVPTGKPRGRPARPKVDPPEEVLEVPEAADVETEQFLADERTPEEIDAEVKRGRKVDPDLKFLDNLEVLVKRDIKAAKGDVRVRQTGVKLLLEIRGQRKEHLAESKRRKDAPYNESVLAALGLALKQRNEDG